MKTLLVRRVVAAALSGWLAQGTAAEGADPARLSVATRYDQDYAPIQYSGPATKNRVWRLQQRLASGEARLEWEPGYGYLRSLLAALEIDPDAQVLVFSSTSLQFSNISAMTPRAVYFNDDTYIGFVVGTEFVEVASVDTDKGVVFYGFDNARARPASLTREGGRCLTCHDTYSMTGGGVPRVMVMSAPIDDPVDTRSWSAASEVDDRTPLAQRWGGWYVTGDTGSNRNFGNQPLREAKLDAKLRELRGRRNPATLADYLDTSHYLRPQSDVVALLVLEHQSYIQNLITRIVFKVQGRMPGENGKDMPRRWSDLNAVDQKRMQAMLEPLVKALFFQEAAPFQDRIAGSGSFSARFPRSGPHDARGRSLRELDLGKRLFRYPLSYQIYSAQFDALPAFAIDYINSRIVEVLKGQDTTGISASMAPEDREAIRQILIDTRPVLAARLK